LFVRKKTCGLKQSFVDFPPPLQIGNVAYFQRQIQLSGFLHIQVARHTN